MIRSMTAFASARGEHESYSWAWELRSVNGKGLDLRLRVPDWLEGLEAALRAELTKSVVRGNVTLTLRLTRSEQTGALALNPAALSSVLDALAQVESEALERGMTLAPSRASDLLVLRGVLEAGTGDEDTAALIARLKAEFGALVRGFLKMRGEEGAALARILGDQLDMVAALTADAAALAEARKDAMAETLRANLARVLDQAQGAQLALGPHLTARTQS